MCKENKITLFNACMWHSDVGLIMKVLWDWNTWGWVIREKIIIFGWTKPLTVSSRFPEHSPIFHWSDKQIETHKLKPLTALLLLCKVGWWKMQKYYPTLEGLFDVRMRVLHLSLPLPHPFPESYKEGDRAVRTTAFKHSVCSVCASQCHD